MKTFFLSLLMTCAIAPMAVHAADDYPSRPITIIVPYPAGGNADLALRALAEDMEKDLGVGVRVTPTPGAGGVTGVQKALGTRPDGYTILVTAQSAITIPSELRDLNFKWDTPRYIATIAAPTMYIGVNRDNSELTSFDAFLAKARREPGKLNIAQVGKTGLHQVTVLRMKKHLGIDITSIPFNGGPPTIAAVLGGHADLVITDNFNPSVRPLALGSIPSEHYPGVKTLSELGYPEIAAGVNYVVALPPGTPDPIAKKVEAMMAKAIESPKYQDVLRSLKWSPLWRDSAATIEHVKAEAMAARELVASGQLALVSK